MTFCILGFVLLGDFYGKSPFNHHLGEEFWNFFQASSQRFQEKRGRWLKHPTVGWLGYDNLFKQAKQKIFGVDVIEISLSIQHRVPFKVSIA